MPNQPGSEKLQILLIDDDEDYLSFLAAVLTSLGHDFDQATDGFGAQQKYKTKQYDLIISDIIMPEMSGIEILKHVKNTHPKTDVILITGYTKEYTFSDIIKLGAADFIEKPFTKDTFEAKINRIQRERALLNELHEKTHNISKRVKELDCLCNINNLFEKEYLSLDQLLKRSIHIIAEAWQYPEHTAVRLIYNSQYYQTANFIKTAWQLKSTITCQGEHIGCLEVYYLKKMPVSHEGPFLKEERNLINVMAQMFGKLTARLNAEKRLWLANKRLEQKVAERTIGLSDALEKQMEMQSELSAVFFSNTDGIITIDTEMRVIRKNNVNMNFLNIDEGHPFKPHHNHLQNECHKILQNTLANKKGVKDYRVEMSCSTDGHAVILLNSALLIDQILKKCGSIMGFNHSQSFWFIQIQRL